MRSAGFLAILPATVRYSDFLNSKDKLLYAELSAMMDVEGSVELTPEVIGYLSDLFEVSADTIISKVGKLSREGHLESRDGTIYISKYSSTKVDVKPRSKPKNDVPDLPEKAEEFVSRWNKIYGTKMRTTTRLMLLLKARLSTFSLDEIADAAERRKLILDDSDWHNKEENLHHKNTYDKFLRNDDEVQKYLVAVTEEKKPKVQNLEFF